MFQQTEKKSRLSVEQYKKLLKGQHSAEEVEKIRECLYLFANLLVDDYLTKSSSSRASKG